mmetsp:Transcript_21886/g.61516  ORF Transcript_21886/g.61516 Transcript_21886/m.61516 type:complete len:361 (-) Transcript_21886:586-1668(-)
MGGGGPFFATPSAPSVPGHGSPLAPPASAPSRGLPAVNSTGEPSPFNSTPPAEFASGPPAMEDSIIRSSVLVAMCIHSSSSSSSSAASAAAFSIASSSPLSVALSSGTALICCPNGGSSLDAPPAGSIGIAQLDSGPTPLDPSGGKGTPSNVIRGAAAPGVSWTSAGPPPPATAGVAWFADRTAWSVTTAAGPLLTPALATTGGAPLYRIRSFSRWPSVLMSRSRVSAWALRSEASSASALLNSPYVLACCARSFSKFCSATHSCSLVVACSARSFSATCSALLSNPRTAATSARSASDPSLPLRRLRVIACRLRSVARSFSASSRLSLNISTSSSRDCTLRFSVVTSVLVRPVRTSCLP